VTNLRFAWDTHKSQVNQQKHGVTFSEAETVFYDENARLIDDPEHSEDEERFIIMGFSVRLRVLVVCHCYREGDDVIRIISARRATSGETSFYRTG